MLSSLTNTRGYISSEIKLHKNAPCSFSRAGLCRARSHTLVNFARCDLDISGLSSQNGTQLPIASKMSALQGPVESRDESSTAKLTNRLFQQHRHSVEPHAQTHMHARHCNPSPSWPHTRTAGGRSWCREVIHPFRRLDVNKPIDVTKWTSKPRVRDLTRVREGDPALFDGPKELFTRSQRHSHDPEVFFTKKHKGVEVDLLPREERDVLGKTVGRQEYNHSRGSVIIFVLFVRVIPGEAALSLGKASG